MLCCCCCCLRADDNGRECQTPAELAIVAEEGSLMGPMMRAINYIADAIKQEFPSVSVSTMAYASTVDPPATAARGESSLSHWDTESLCHLVIYQILVLSTHAVTHQQIVSTALSTITYIVIYQYWVEFTLTR